VSFKHGDKVKGFGHIYDYLPDGTVGTYLRGNPNGHILEVPNQGTFTFDRVESLDGRSELDRYKEDVLFPALERKNAKYSWCGEYDEFLKEIDLTPPTPVFPDNPNTLIEVNSDKYRGQKVVWRRLAQCNLWVDADGSRYTYQQAQRQYVRTIFDGEK